MSGDTISDNQSETITVEAAATGENDSTPPAATTTSQPNLSKCLEVNDLDQYLISLLTGPALTRILRDAFRILYVASISTQQSSFLYKPLDVLRKASATLLDSSSLQAVVVHAAILLANGGVSPACQAFGLQVQQRDGNIKTTKLLLFVFLQALLPKVYEILKERIRDKYIRDHAEDGSFNEEDWEYHADETLNDTIARHQRLHLQRKAAERRKRAWKKVLQSIDTVIPMVRLAVLLKCWRSLSTASQSTTAAPTVALALSGLSFATTSTTTTNQQQPSSSFFVLYAHRRWMQHQGMALLPVLITPLVGTIKETYGMLRQVLVDENPLLQYGREWAMTRRHKTGKRLISNSQTISNDITGPCPLCKIEHIPVPYQMQSCGHMACYTCLWEQVEKHVKRQASKRQSLPPCPLCYSPIEHCQAV